MKDFNFENLKSIGELEDLIRSKEINVDLVEIRKDYDFAKDVYAESIRISGDPLITHALTVAGYIVQLNLDTVSIVAAILHDAVDKTEISIDLLDKKFGTDV